MFEISASKFYHSKFALDWQRVWGDWCLTAEPPTCSVLGAAQTGLGTDYLGV